MPGDQELEYGDDTEGTPADIDDESESNRSPSLEEVRAGFMLLDL